MPDQITSLTNPKIKQVVNLRHRKKRDANDLTLIEGEREIEKAVEAGVDIKEVYYCKTSVNNCKAVMYEVPEAVFKKISYGDKEEGVLAVAQIQPAALSDVKTKTTGLFVVLEHIEKPGNLGAILRSCDGAGVDAVFVTDQATDIYNPNVIRASLGAVFTVPVVTLANKEALDYFKDHHVRIIASSPDSKDVYTDMNAMDATALILGSEDKGLSAFWLKEADQTVSIPMMGTIDSLNVSASTAILLYEINRQRS